MAEKRSTLLALLLGAALLWGSSRLGWVAAVTSDDLRGVRTTSLTGAVWATELVPLALVALAGVAAVLAVRGLALRLLGLVVVAAGVLAVLAPVRVLAGADRARAAVLLDPPSTADAVTVTTSVLGPLLAALGAVVTVLGGAALLRAPRRADGLSARFQTPAARREQAVQDAAGTPVDADLSERRLWDALDAGLDPTDEPPPPAARDPRRDAGHPPVTLTAEQTSDRGEGGPSRS